MSVFRWRWQPHHFWQARERPLVAQSIELADAAPAILEIQSDGRIVQLHPGIQKPRP